MSSKTRPDAPPASTASSAEVQAWIERLEAENRRVGRRNSALWVALAAGVVLLAGVLFAVYHSTVRTYAVLDDVSAQRSPANQGRLEIAFQVVSPGKVFYRRTSGSIQTEMVDYFSQPGPVTRAWSWVYEPGKEIDVSLRYRGGLWWKSSTQRFPTSPRADIVVLMDTTGSMSRSINLLKEKCLAFSTQLKSQSLAHRFALVGFGDVSEDDWLDQHGFTDDVQKFQNAVGELKRFDGGDVPESALDALEAALSLPLDADAMRRFYLVTDAEFHPQAKSGATAADLAGRLDEAQVLLNVFSRGSFAKSYAPLVGTSGKFQEMDDFGKVLSEGRILED